MAGRHPAGAGICDQHRGAIGPAYPQALASAIAYQSIGFWPGLAGRLARREDPIAVDLLGSVHAHPGTHVPRQDFGPSPLPLAGEKPVLEALKEVALQVIAAIGAHPGPALQAVEVPVGLVKGWINRFGHGLAAQASGRSRSSQKPSKR